MSDVVFRKAIESDVPFILSAWLKSYHHARPGGVESKHYYAGHHEIVVRVLGNSDSVIACPHDNEGLIVGFCVSSKRTIAHYLYLKNSFRDKYLPGANIAHRLLRECVDVDDMIVVSHRTDAGMNFLSKHAIQSVYNPYAAYLAGIDAPNGD
jgi:hypothetical protein